MGYKGQFLWVCDRCSRTWEDAPYIVFPFEKALCPKCMKELRELVEEWMKR